MTLYINTTDFNEVIYAISNNGEIKKQVYKIDPHQSHETLTCLGKFLKSAGIKNSDIKKIVVNKGPGSYTGVRIGVTHALALGYAWSIPVKPLVNEKFINELTKLSK